MAGQPITNQVARKALAKLEATDVTKKGAAHPKFAIYHRGAIVAITGLRHSSKRDIPLPHIKRDLRVNARFVIDLAACPKSRNDWLSELGLVTDEPEPELTEEPEPE